MTGKEINYDLQGKISGSSRATTDTIRTLSGNTVERV
jgi:hypothetical protein